MSEENTELELVSNNDDVAPAKKVKKKAATKKPTIPCGDCMSRNICKAQGWCKKV